MTIHTHVPYNDDGDPHHRLDLYLSDSSAIARPTLVVIHGGGFVAGSKDSLRDMAVRLATSGYAVVVPDYRLAPVSRYPSQLQDLACAFFWVLDNARAFGFDTARIGLAGDSAGGNLAAILAAIDDLGAYAVGCPHPIRATGTIRAVAVFYPVVDLTLETYGDFFAQYVGADPAQEPSTWREASPLEWINGNEPPFLLIHGLWDVRVPATESEKLRDALEAAGVPVEFLRIPEADHNFLTEDPYSPATLQSMEAVEAFFDRTLLQPGNSPEPRSFGRTPLSW